jgi:hypothetical protein
VKGASATWREKILGSALLTILRWDSMITTRLLQYHSKILVFK